ncbi:hypothetical protein ACFFF5_16845 [Lederbergia wuyishanensis]|uniref:NADH dehydrogenase subunit 6 n=1 Tax=Lederbergia wuyishanensis TaxID=1347903 RepID=A0ABU0DA09_9BACI|nr:hypothetical protein [Lederbergia wuyishanensis]MCJ8008472.1 hypothetical protein [Lederbergia wuyishanensis]MDQ0345215.1 hypothetical protein [Lederbergia wuyishanensis]
MGYFISFVLSILLTSLSYFLGSHLLKNGIIFWQALLIGASVVSLGAITEALRAPIWLIVLVPFPVGMFLLFLFLQKPIHVWFLTYVTILAIYTGIHVIMSYFFKFHSLIPAWKIS